MSYDKEFYEWARLHPADVSAVGINDLLDEIDRLQSLNQLRVIAKKLYDHLVLDCKSNLLSVGLSIHDDIREYERLVALLPQPEEQE